MRGVIFLMLLAVAYTSVIDSKPCKELLNPVATKEVRKAVMDKCMDAQPGLKAIIDDLIAAAEMAKPHPGCRISRSGNPSRLLKVSGHANEATTLQKCMANENGHLLVAANGTSTFDVAKFKAEIKALVAGTSSQVDTELGLEKCPVDHLLAYNVYDYMRCVQTFCVTGAAPTKP